MPFVHLHDNAPAEKLYYEDHGRGIPVVLIHGWPLSGRAWEKQIGALVSAGFRVITYDRRGFGESFKPWSRYNYDVLAHDLHMLIEKLGLIKPALVGFSMGGGEVARYIGTYGTENISAVVFAASVAPFMYKVDDNPEGAIDDEGIAAIQAGVKEDRIAFLEDFTKTFFSDGSDTPLVSEANRRYHHQIASFASPKGTLDCIASFSTTDFRQDIKKIDVPTLVIHGDSDQIVPFEASGQRVHETVPDAQLVLIEGGPHGVNATHSEAFNQGLIDFLSPLM